MSISVTPAVNVNEERAAEITRLLRHLSPDAEEVLPDNEIFHLQPHQGMVLLAFSGDRLVGMLTISVYTTLRGRHAVINDVIRTPDAGGLGVGDELMARGLGYARHINVRKVELTSRSSRAAARALYARHGFTERDTGVFSRKLD